MGNPTVTPSQDDLMSRLKTVSSSGQDTASSGDDLLTRLNGVAGTTPIKMVGPRGNQVTVSPNDVKTYRTANYAVHPDNPGVSKFVNPDGKIAYALPNEIEDFKSSGSTQIRPDGTFALQNIWGEDPLEEQKRLQRVYAALTPQEKKTQNAFELKEAGKAGLGATVSTAAGVAGAGPLSAAMEAGGTALGGTEAYQLLSSSPRLYAEYLVKQGLGGVSKYALEHKLGTAIVIDQLAKALGIQKSTVLHKLITAGGSAMAE